MSHYKFQPKFGAEKQGGLYPLKEASTLDSFKKWRGKDLRDEINSLNSNIVKSLGNLRDEPWNTVHLRIILTTIEKIIIIGRLLSDEKVINDATKLRNHYKNVENIYANFDDMCKILYEIDLRLNEDMKRYC